MRRSGFEKDPRDELLPMAAADSFTASDAMTGAALDRWVERTPDHFAPYLARATHRIAVGYEDRGGEYIHKTPKENLAAMHEAFARARLDMDKALVLRPRLVAAIRVGLKMARADARDGEELIAHALKLCPTCFQVRVTRMVGLTPRWGGSYAAMRKVADDAPVAKNPRLRLLRGYLDYDRSYVFQLDKNLDQSLAASTAACAVGEHSDFLLRRGQVHAARGEAADALADFERAVALRPGDPFLLRARARSYLNAAKYEEGARDLLAVLQIDPTEGEMRDLVPSAVGGLVFLANRARGENRRDEELRLMDLAAELAPGDPTVAKRRTAGVFGSAFPAASAVPEIRAAASANPNDFRAFQKLDYTLAREGHFDEVIALWTDFLSRNPNEPRAYFERAGAYHHARRPAEAHADFDKACALGLTEGCTMAKRFPAPR